MFADVITLSSGGSILRAWNLPDGQMVWESTLLGPKASKPLLLVPVSESCLNYPKVMSYGSLNAKQSGFFVG